MVNEKLFEYYNKYLDYLMLDKYKGIFNDTLYHSIKENENIMSGLLNGDISPLEDFMKEEQYEYFVTDVLDKLVEYEHMVLTVSNIVRNVLSQMPINYRIKCYDRIIDNAKLKYSKDMKDCKGINVDMNLLHCVQINIE